MRQAGVHLIVLLSVATTINGQWKNPRMSQANANNGFSGASGASDGIDSDDAGSMGNNNNDQQLIHSTTPVPTWQYSNVHPPTVVNQRISDYIASKVLEFAYNVGGILGETSSFSKTEVFSPLSTMSLLALVLLGAKGSSYNELADLFGLNNDNELRNYPTKFHEQFAAMLRDLQQSDISTQAARVNANWRNTAVRSENPRNIHSGGHIIKVANGLFTQDDYSLNKVYADIVQSAYNADLKQLDFLRGNARARDEINKWVSTNTFGKIPSIITDEIPQSTKMIIASALYFKGVWENLFISKATVIDDFFPNGMSQPPIKVKMMATGGIFPSYESPEYDCRIIGLPYKGNMTTMYVIQPNHSSRAKLKALQKALDPQKMEELISKMTLKTSVLAFPKISVLRSTNMKTILNRLGVNSIFRDGVSDLSLITSSRPSQLQEQSIILDRFNERPLYFTSQPEAYKANETINIRIGRSKRQQSMSISQALQELERERLYRDSVASDLVVEDVLHKVNFIVNEQGTEAAAATLTYLRRSGPEVLFRADTPFLVLIRHDPTKLTLFYGIINEPEF